MSIDTLNFTYDLKEAGIKKSHIIDMLYTKKETYQYDDSSDQKYLTSKHKNNYIW